MTARDDSRIGRVRRRSGATQEPRDAPTQASGNERVAAVPKADGGVAKAREDYEAALKGTISESRGSRAIAETVEGAEAPRKEIDELRRQGDKQRVDFELQLAGARNVKAQRVLLTDCDTDIEKLKAVVP